MGNCWANVFRRRNVRRHIVLILIGLDNAGKTKTVNNLAGEKDDKVLPTVGFKAVNLVHKDTPVTIYDLGGGPHFRQIWSQYYSEVHGIIFVIDSSDYSRLDECKEVLEEVLSHDKISGKPVLVLANKQDKTGALDDIDVVEKLNIEPLVNKKFDRLLEVCVHDQNVAKAGDVASLCPNVRSLDVSRNLFSNWREVIQLSAQLPDLRELDVSKNRMAIDMPEETLTQLSINFANLEKLNVSVCDYEWSDIIALSHLWPKVTELIAAYNRIRTMTPPVVTLRTLTILRLDGNPIDSWGEVISVGHLKNLKILSLNDCQIEEIRFNDNPNNAKVDVFESLEVLFLNRNRIKDWRSVSELDKLNCLKKLYFLKNPIQNTEDYDTGSQLITAKIGTLQELNGSAITRELRRGAEYDYMKRYGAEWKLAQGDSTRKLIFDIEHCRFQELISRYGIPDDSLLVKQPKNTTLTSQLLEITLRDENGKSFKKKFPSTMAVQKLVTLAQRLFTKFGHSGIPNLYLLDDQLKGAEICLDNTMKDLAYFSVKNNDIILVRFR